MPQVTVYIRQEDLEKWKALQGKSEFLHNALNTLPQKNASGPTAKMTISSSEVPMTADNPHQLKEVLKDDYTLCKHGMHPGFCKYSKPGKVCK